MEKEITIIGNAPNNKKEEAREGVRQALFNNFESLPSQAQEDLKRLEYPKSEKEIAVIHFINQETSRLMQEAGLEPYDVPEENFYIIPPELYRKISKSGTASAYIAKQGIFFDAWHARNNFPGFSATALHEILHLKAHLSLEVNEVNGKVQKTSYREGVTVSALQKHHHQGKYHEHFLGLHEAIVSETEKRILMKFLDRPELATEKEWLTSEEAKEIKKRLANERDVSEDDIIWVDRGEKGDPVIVCYDQQRNVLNYLCVEIQKQFPNEFQNPEEVYKVFLRAHFTGRLLEIGRLVERTFGEGSFRMLGNMSTDSESGILHWESLEKARRRQLKKLSNRADS